jgi:hypothetical protein
MCSQRQIAGIDYQVLLLIDEYYVPAAPTASAIAKSLRDIIWEDASNLPAGGQRPISVVSSTGERNSLSFHKKMECEQWLIENGSTTQTPRRRRCGTAGKKASRYHAIARLFDRHHTSVSGINAATGGEARGGLVWCLGSWKIQARHRVICAVSRQVARVGGDYVLVLLGGE